MTTARSTDPQDYQRLPQAIGAMAKSFADGYEIALHHHERDQLLYAARGTMGMRTARQAWIVPPGGAIHIPAGTPHAVVMHGAVDMRTLYINPDRAGGGVPPRALCVIKVSALLRELILALSEEPVDYAPGSRADRIAALTASELTRAGAVALDYPLPQDPRLQRLCAALIAEPGDDRTLDGWSEIAGASTRTLARLFRRDLEMSFRRWRQRVRFHSAVEALGRGETIARVAATHGYRSVSAFSSAFGAVMGAPPSTFNGLDRDRRDDVLGE